MTLLLKDPDAVLDYLVDWGAQYLDGDEIVDSRWSLDPAEEGGVAVISDGFDASSATVQVGAGRAGRIYRLVNRVTLASGKSDSRSIVLRVEQR